jgi:hypothetical protein
MRIYINNLNLDIVNEIAEIFKENLIKTDNYIELYTNEGIYRVEDKAIYFLDINDKAIQIIEKYYNNFTLIIDSSFYEKNLSTSIHGETHISSQITEKRHKLYNSSPISLVIKYSLYESALIPNDIYFEAQKDIDVNDLFIKKEINEFLSVLN